MSKRITDEMIFAGIKEAIRQKMLPFPFSEVQHLETVEAMRAILEAALEAEEDVETKGRRAKD